MNTSRRRFLQTGARFAAVTALGAPLLGGLGCSTARGARAGGRQLKKAIMWDTFGMKGTVLEKFRALKAAGFHGVEASSHMNREEVAKAYRETGLLAASVCGSRHWTKTLSHQDEKVRAEGVEALKHTIQDAKHYGAPTVLLVPGVVNKDVTYDQCWERSIAGIRAVLPLCEETGVKIAVENVWNNFLMKPEQARDYVDAINSKWVGWHFDIGNHIRFGPSEEWIKVLGKRILALHIKEYSTKTDASGKAPGFGVKLLQGSNNWPAIMAELDKIGYAGWAITEMPGSQTKDEATLKEFSATLDQVLAS